MANSTYAQWVIEEFWPLYPADLCGDARKKGSRGQLIKYVERDKPDEKERERIIGNLRAQIAYDREKKRVGEDVYRWPYATTYWNNRRYDDEIGSHYELQQAAASRKCRCGNETMGPGISYCVSCHPDTRGMTPLLREQYKKMGLIRKPGESEADWALRVRREGLRAIKQTNKRANKSE